MPNTSERRERRELQTPLEKHLRQQFRPWTSYAHKLIDRCRQSLSRGVDVVSMDDFDVWSTEYEQQGAAEQERLATLRLLFRRGLLQMEDGHVRMNPTLEWSKDQEKDVIIEAIKLRPLKEVDIPTAVDVAHACQRALSGGQPVLLSAVSADVDVRPDQLVAALNLLDTAGVVSFDTHTDHPLISAGAALQQNDRSLELLIFSILALRNSRHVRDVTEGWNRLLLSEEFIAATLNTQFRNASRKPDVRGYASPGYLSSAMPKTPGHSPHSYFFSINPHDGERFRSSPRYEQWLANHRVGENAVRTGVQEAWEQSRSVEGLPATVRLISAQDLEQALSTHDATLQRASMYGYVCPAADRDDTIVFRKKGALGKQARHYFIARHRKEMSAWEQSDAFKQWREQRRLLPELLHEWSTKVLETLPPTASFVDLQYQPAYVVDRATITEAGGGLFAIAHLGRLGHISATQRMLLEETTANGTREFFLFWPDAAKGQAYKQALLEKFEKPGKVLDENNRQLFHWRVQQLARSKGWPEHPNKLPVPPWNAVRFVSYADAMALLADGAPLSISGLVRRGYLIHAQASPTRKGVGYFIFCPNGEIQAKEIQQSPWFHKVQQTQRARGFANLGH